MGKSKIQDPINRQWINEAMNEECKNFDIGSDGRQTPSIYYVMEREQIAARSYTWYYPVPWAP